jgi:hypothetical protein
VAFSVSATALVRATRAIAFGAILVVVPDPRVLAGMHAVPFVLLTAQRSPVEEVVHRKEHV